MYSYRFLLFSRPRTSVFRSSGHAAQAIDVRRNLQRSLQLG